MRKPRLFWIMALAFVLAIVLGVCGMAGFATLALVSASPGAPSAPSAPSPPMRDMPPAYAAVLADYYVANGDSWEGVDRRLDAAPLGGPFSFSGYTLADAEGRVVATNRSAERGQLLDAGALRGGVPVIVRGERVGTLVTLRSPGQSAGWGGGREVPPFFRSVAAAGLGLMLVLVALGLLFAGWLNRPLRHLTAAAGDLAAGRLDVQVPPARVRELDELSQAFNRMARSLADADRQRRQLTADVAHELRTPLTIIKGRLEGIQDGVYQPTAEQVARLLAETELLERLIEDLRVLALAEAGQLPLYREPTDPAGLLRRAAAAFAAQAESQGVALHVEAGAELPPVDADPQRIAQVLSNLVSNALRHTPAGGAVTLRASSTEDRGPTAQAGSETQRALVAGPSSFVLVEVADTGAGIAPGDLPHIFERFWRADRSRARGSGGAGLGLAIARQIVEAHGGTIAARSGVGQGTTIAIALPAHQDHG